MAAADQTTVSQGEFGLNFENGTQNSQHASLLFVVKLGVVVSNLINKHYSVTVKKTHIPQFHWSCTLVDLV